MVFDDDTGDGVTQEEFGERGGKAGAEVERHHEGVGGVGAAFEVGVDEVAIGAGVAGVAGS
ncbi:MAG: hypothetical protein ACR2MB_15775 [Acidimicrobiales bacterium]